jgi:hypothetical protein
VLDRGGAFAEPPVDVLHDADHAAGGGVEVVGLVGEVVTVRGELAGQGFMARYGPYGSGVSVTSLVPSMVGVHGCRAAGDGFGAVGGLMRAWRGFVSPDVRRREERGSAGDGEAVAELRVAPVAEAVDAGA